MNVVSKQTPVSHPYFYTRDLLPWPMYNVPGLIKTHWGLIFSAESPPFLIFQTLRYVLISIISWSLQVNSFPEWS